MIVQITIFLLCSFIVWWGAGLVVNAVVSLSHSFKISAFTISFFVLGLLTSLPEITIGITALSRNEAPIMVGNLVGATLVVFLLIIPLLAITGGNVKLPNSMHRPQLILSLLTILAPAILIADRNLHIWEGVFAVAIYLALFIVLSRRESLYEKILAKLRSTRHVSQYRFPKIVLGMALVSFASSYMVSAAEYFAQALNWSPFIVGLLIVSLGTNIPELSLVIRAAFSRKTEVALADYIGSAAANTLLIGVFSISSLGSIQLPNHASVRIVILLASLILFYVFIRSKNNLSRREGLVLLLIYVIFVVIEITQA